ncbi:MAG: hypothetical protein ABJC07_03070 [Acidobacteriota bacterium]
MTGELIPFPAPLNSASPEEARASAEGFLESDFESIPVGSSEFRFDQPETLLALCQLIESRLDGSPALMARAAVTAYDLLKARTGSDNAFLFDEREYYLGELALLAGTALRVLFKVDEARTWFDRAQAWFLSTANLGGDIARVSYQRLALSLELRQLPDVLHLARPLRDAFLRTGAKEMALKCSYLEALALRELGRSDEALAEFEAICGEARDLKSPKMLGSALVCLVQLRSESGHADLAAKLVAEAEPILRSANNRVALGKLYWGVGVLMRSQSRPADAIQAFRAAQQEFAQIELPADGAALHLVIADLLLETGQERQAEWEIRAALPIIDELKMVPEGFAAMSLLRESLRRRSIDRGALRKLHGYFEDIGS